MKSVGGVGELRDGDLLISCNIMDGWTDGQGDIQSCMYATENRVEELRSFLILDVASTI